MRLVLNPIWWWPLLLLAGVLLLAFVVRFYLAALAGKHGRWGVVTFSLRVLAVCMVLFAAFRPTLVINETRKQSASLVLLYDATGSMKVGDAWNGMTRWQAMREVDDQAQPALDRLAEVLKVRRFTFDSQPQEMLQWTNTPDGPRTALGDSIRDVLRAVPGRVAAIILLSDGANTTGTPPLSVAESLRDQAIPLHTVGFGKEIPVEAARDLALRTIDAGPTVFEKNKLIVRSELGARGFASQTVNLKLLFDQRSVANDTADLPREDVVQNVEMDYVPTVPGEHKVTMVVSEREPRKGELVETNNQISTWVTVLKGGLRVLYIDGGLGSWEPRFIRTALDKSPDIQVEFLSLRNPLETRSALELFDRALFDVVLIRDVPSGWFPSVALDRLRELVDAGLGLGMLGGRRSFGAGDYGRGPLADLMPVVMHPGDPQLEDTGEPLPIRVVPTLLGKRFVLRLGDPQQTDQIWNSLAPWPGGSSFAGVTDRAETFATSPSGTPLIVGQEYGRGRTMALAGDTTWLWARQPETAAYHRRFWRQVIMWLAHKEQAGDQNVWVRLARRRVPAQQGLEITAGAEDENGLPIQDAEFEATIKTPTGEQVPLKLIPQGDSARATFYNTQAAGDYEVAVLARRQQSVLGYAPEQRFLVFEDDQELSAPAANLELLAQMSQTTGGKFIHPEEFPTFLDKMRDQDLRLEKVVHATFHLWDNWPFFLLFVALLGIEWVMRKWKGLV